MSTIKLYDSMPYTTGFTAKIVDVIEDLRGDIFSFFYIVILDRTLFFPESGGQSADKGYLHINGVKYSVTHVSINEYGVINHHITTTTPITQSLIGKEINGDINWKHRFSNMQQHSGEHILSGLVHSLFGFHNVGFHLSDNIVTADFDHFLESDAIIKLEEKANEVIYKDLPISCYYPPSDIVSNTEFRSKGEFSSHVRLVEIEGVDRCACCCPHVRSTGEIGVIKILSSIRYKGGTRVTFVCGKRALDYYNFLLKQSTEISQFLSAEKDSLMPAIHKLNTEKERLMQQVRELNSKLLDAEVREAMFVSNHPLVFVENYGMTDMRNSVKKMIQESHIYCGIFSGNDAEGYAFVLGSKDLDCHVVSEKLETLFGAKGGGNTDMIQGFLKGNKNRIIHAIQSLY